MDHIKLAACRDELEKIAGSLQGFTRVGRRPISAMKYIAKDGQKKMSEIVKTSGPVGALALFGLGSLATLQAQKAKRRYEIGRQMELQQGY